MKVIEKLNLEPIATFQEIASELGEKETAVFECYKRALAKLKITLRRRGYKIDDFFGEEK